MNGVVQHIPYMGSATRGTRRQNDLSVVQNLLRDYRVTCDDISFITNIPKSTVSRALDFKHFYRCTHINLVRVRSAVVDLLLGAGWPEDGVDDGPNLTELWDDYNHHMDKVA